MSSERQQQVAVTTSVVSVLEQRVSTKLLYSFEIILVADRANASTRAVAEELLRSAPHRIRLLENNGKPGPAAARNLGIRAASGEWIAFLDGDDLWTEDSLSVRLRALSENPEAEWLGAEFAAWSGTESEISRLLEINLGWLRRNEATRRMLSRAFETESPQLLHKPAREFITQVLCSTCTVIAKRDLLTRVGLFDESLLRAQDVHLWYRLASAANYLFVPTISALYRQRPSTVVRRGASPRGHHNSALKKLLADPLLTEYRDDLRRKLALTLIEEANYMRGERRFSSAAMLSLRSAQLCPLQVAAYRTLLASIIHRD